jgi:pullulanase/glycogen debranching enzyme
MGVTHVQLLPIFDFRTVDETRLNDDSYAQQTKFG